MLFEQFKSEADFRDSFLKPLLNKFGFFGVTEMHGRREFGKDFVFGELTKFGTVKYHAAQVKHQKQINHSQKVGLGKLMSQVEEAFSVPFKISDSVGERHISQVYVFNSGSITEGAQEVIFSRLAKQNYGDNVHFLGGDRLDALNRWSTFSSDLKIREQLMGLANHLTLNIPIWDSILKDAKNDTAREGRCTLMSAIEDFLALPVCTDYVNVGKVQRIWQLSRIVENIVRRYSGPIYPAGETRKTDFILLTDHVCQLLSLSESVHSQIITALARLRPV